MVGQGWHAWPGRWCAARYTYWGPSGAPCGSRKSRRANGSPASTGSVKHGRSGWRRWWWRVRSLQVWPAAYGWAVGSNRPRQFPQESVAGVAGKQPSLQQCYLNTVRTIQNKHFAQIFRANEVQKSYRNNFYKTLLESTWLIYKWHAQSTFTNFTLNDTTVVHLVHLQVHPPIAIHQNYYRNLSNVQGTRYDYVIVYV